MKLSRLNIVQLGYTVVLIGGQVIDLAFRLHVPNVFWWTCVGIQFSFCAIVIVKGMIETRKANKELEARIAVWERRSLEQVEEFRSILNRPVKEQPPKIH